MVGFSVRPFQLCSIFWRLSVRDRVRHPLYVGWLIVFWATPTMTIGHLFFAVGTTAYILVAIQLEERDLTDAHGVAYVSYRNEVPMLIPRFRSRQPADSGVHRS